MAKFKGTNGNDTITGSAGDDTIVPLLGQDTIDGGMGYDTLVVDYSSLADAYWFSTMTLAADGTWTGAVTGGANSAPNYATFSNIEQIKFTATQADDYLTVDLGTRTPDKARLSLDGSGGDDTLSVLGGDLTKRLTLAVDANGAAKANFATLAGWDNYDIGLGLSVGNSVALGAGDDSVSSSGGQDKIDGGGGHDQWNGYYGAFAGDLNFFFSAGAAMATATVGSTQLAEIKNVEAFSLQTGDGDDVVTAYGGAGVFNGGGGSDEFTLNPFGAGAPMRYEVYLANASVLAGTASVLGGGDTITFYNYEDITCGGSVDADQFVFDASQYQLANSGFNLNFSGGDGADILLLDLRAQGAASVLKGGENAGYVNGLGDLNVIGWTGIETLTVKFGAGDDLINPYVARYVTVDGGAGVDTLDLSAATTAQIVDLENTNGQTIGGSAISVVATNVENVTGSKYDDTIVDNGLSNTIVGYEGNDYFYSSAASTAGADAYYGSNGNDLIDYYYATTAVYVSLAITTAQNTGGGGIDTLIAIENLNGSQFDDILTGSDGNDGLIGRDGDDVLEGLGGADGLAGLAGNDTASYAHAASAVTVSLAISGYQNTGGAGSDALSSIENLVGSAWNDTLTGDGGANRLSGGRGADKLTGGGSADTFSYASALDSTGSAYDTIADFSHAQGDKIDLRAVDAIASSPRFNDAFSWIGSDAFHGVSGELREVAARGGGYWLYGDTNGDKTADLTIFVNSSTPPLPNSDIVL